MSVPEVEGVLEQLQYVFAGLVASWVFYGLTNYKRPTPFDRLVQAIVYTIIIQLTAEFIAKTVEDTGLATYGHVAASPVLILGLSFSLGFILAVAANNDWPHKWLVRFPSKWNWKITSKSVYGSNLSHAFETRSEYIVLTLKNSRRIYGWPQVWPDHPGEDYFILTAYEWLPEAGDGSISPTANHQKPSGGVILIAAKDVDVIEFIPNEEIIS